MDSKKHNNKSMHSHTGEKPPGWALIVSVSGGVTFLVVLLIIAVFISRPTSFQIFVFRVVLALAAAAFGATITGFMKINIPLWSKGLISAGGALGLFVLVYNVNPPAILLDEPLNQEVQNKNQIKKSNQSIANIYYSTPYDIPKKDNNVTSFLDIYWQDRIYCEYDFDIYPSNTFSIYSNKAQIKSIVLCITNIYNTDDDYLIKAFGKGNGGEAHLIYDCRVSIDPVVKNITLFRMNSKETKLEEIDTNRKPSELRSDNKTLHEVRVIFENNDNSKKYSFDYYFEIRWTGYDPQYKVIKNYIERSKLYTYSFNSKKLFSNIIPIYQPKNVYYYISDEYSKMEFEFWKEDFLLSLSIEDEQNNTKRNINIFDIRRNDTWVLTDRLDINMKKNIFVIFDHDFLFVINPQNKKNKSISGDRQYELYVTETIKGESNIKRSIFNEM